MRATPFTSFVKCSCYNEYFSRSINTLLMCYVFFLFLFQEFDPYDKTPEEYKIPEENKTPEGNKVPDVKKKKFLNASVTTRHVILACGPIAYPSKPDFPGLETFKGDILQTQRWDKSIPLAGKRVGIIGTGCSAAQV